MIPGDICTSTMPPTGDFLRALEEGPHVFVQAGQMFVTTSPCLMSTIVGSCVSACLWDRRRSWGGMNHFVLARAPLLSRAVARPLSYGDLAVSELVERLLEMGSSTADLEAKIFGGANLLGPGASDGEGLGSRNVAVARAVLAERRVVLAAQDVGGRRGRKLIFRSNDGSVHVRQL
jgi:chemotaxis protein CheD